MLGPLWTVALSCGFAPLPPRDRPADALKPVLLLKGKDYFIHVLPLRPLEIGKWVWPEDPGIPGFTQTVPSGSAVLHTTTAGEMKVLAFGHSSVTHGPPMGVDRIYYKQTRLVGVAADAERLWVLEWRIDTVSPPNGLPRKGVDPSTGMYYLLVFRPADGKLLRELPLEEGDFPKEPPVEWADAGPLQVRGDTVSCFGVTFEFKDTQLIKQRYEKKP